MAQEFTTLSAEDMKAQSELRALDAAARKKVKSDEAATRKQEQGIEAMRSRIAAETAKRQGGISQVKAARSQAKGAKIKTRK